jgi:hypothetical protein
MCHCGSSPNQICCGSLACHMISGAINGWCEACRIVVPGVRDAKARKTCPTCGGCGTVPSGAEVPPGTARGSSRYG